MACYSQDKLQCVAAEIAGEIWPAGWRCSGCVPGIGVLYFVASPTQRLSDYEVVYHPAGTQVLFRLGTAFSCYGISAADTSLLTIQGYLGQEYVRLPEEFPNYSEYLLWWEEFSTWDIFSIELQAADHVIQAEAAFFSISSP